MTITPWKFCFLCTRTHTHPYTYVCLIDSRTRTSVRAVQTILKAAPWATSKLRFLKPSSPSPAWTTWPPSRPGSPLTAFERTLDSTHPGCLSHCTAHVCFRGRIPRTPLCPIHLCPFLSGDSARPRAVAGVHEWMVMSWGAGPPPPLYTPPPLNHLRDFK